MIVIYRQFSNFSARIYFVLDQHAKLDFYKASSLKQQSVGRHVALLKTLFSFRANQSLLFLLNAACLEATNTNFTFFGLTRLGLKPTINLTRGEHANHYATDAVFNYPPLIQNNMDDLNSHEHFKPT